MSPDAVRPTRRTPAAVLLTVALSLAGSGGLAAQDSTVVRFTRLERALADALIARDSAALTTLVAPEFLLTAPNGDDALPRAPWIANALHRIRLDSLGIRDVAVTAHTGDSATVRLRLWWHPIFDGQRRGPEENLLADTWVRRADAWQMTRRVVLETDPPRGPRPPSAPPARTP